MDGNKMSGKVSITTSTEEFDVEGWMDEHAEQTMSPNEMLSGVYIRLTITQKKALQKESHDRDVSMSYIIRDLLENK